MRKVLLALIAGLLLCAQSTFPAFPPGLFQNRGAIDGTPAATYQGPYDIIGVSSYAWGSPYQCYGAAFSGTIADITDASTGNTTGTRLTCSGGVISAVVSASACTFVTGNACSPLATTCAVSCNVRVVYDQSGNTNCTTACNWTQTTNSARPTFVQVGTNSKYCMFYASISSQTMTTPTFTPTANQPWSATTVAERSSNFTTSQSLFSQGTSRGFYYAASANTPQFTAGTLVGKTASDSALHSLDGMASGASSIFSIDGTNGTAVNAGSNALATTIGFVIAANAGSKLDGYVCSLGYWPGDQSSKFSSLYSNDHLYWGF